MAEAVETNGKDSARDVASDSAEKAYAAAAENAVVAAAPAVPVTAAAAPLAFPAKPTRTSAVTQAPKPAAPQAFATPAAMQADLVMPAKPAPVAAKKPASVKQTAVVKKAAPAKKVSVAKPAAKPVKPVAAKIQPKTTPVIKIKDTIMATKQTKDFTKTVKTVAADVQAKAKLALAKGSVVLGEASEFTKGNVEAIVTSGKILGAGLQGLGKTYAAEGKSAYETATADVKQLAAVKSPTDFVRLQTSILRRNFDHAFDFGGKNSEAVIKLASETFAPISARASLAIAKVKKAA